MAGLDVNELLLLFGDDYSSLHIGTRMTDHEIRACLLQNLTSVNTEIVQVEGEINNAQALVERMLKRQARLGKAKDALKRFMVHGVDYNAHTGVLAQVSSVELVNRQQPPQSSPAPRKRQKHHQSYAKSNSRALTTRNYQEVDDTMGHETIAQPKPSFHKRMQQLNPQFTGLPPADSYNAAAPARVNASPYTKTAATSPPPVNASPHSMTEEEQDPPPPPGCPPELWSAMLQFFRDEAHAQNRR